MVIKVQKDGQWIKIPYLTTDVAVGEAPKDGKQYARQDGTWSQVVIPEVDLSGVEADIAANTAAISANTTAIATKVDKVTGKQLSTNDYTTEEKTKLEDIPTPNSIVTTNDNRLTLATASKSGLMSGEQFQKLEKTTPDEYIKRNGSVPFINEQDMVRDGNLTLRFRDADNTIRGYVGSIVVGGNITEDKSGIWLRNHTTNKTLMLRDTGELTYNEDKIWHAGNDGADSGLDADTVDGIQTARIIYGDNATGSINFSEDLTSFNNITKSGFYRCDANPKIKLLVSIHHPTEPSNYILQIGTTYEQDLSKNMLNYRLKTRDGGWSDPRTIVDTSTVLTQAEYDALGSSVNSDGKIYFIKE